MAEVTKTEGADPQAAVRAAEERRRAAEAAAAAQRAAERLRAVRTNDTSAAALTANAGTSTLVRADPTAPRAVALNAEPPPTGRPPTSAPRPRPPDAAPPPAPPAQPAAQPAADPPATPAAAPTRSPEEIAAARTRADRDVAAYRDLIRRGQTDVAVADLSRSLRENSTDRDYQARLAEQLTPREAGLAYERTRGADRRNVTNTLAVGVRAGTVTPEKLNQIEASTAGAAQETLRRDVQAANPERDAAAARVETAQTRLTDAQRAKAQADQRLAATLSRLGPAITPQQREAVVNDHRRRYASAYEGEAAAARELRDSLRDPNLDQATQRAGYTRLAGTSEARAAETWATEQLRTATTAADQTALADIGAQAVATQVGDIAARHSDNPETYLQELQRRLEPFKAAYTAASQLPGGAQAARALADLQTWQNIARDLASPEVATARNAMQRLRETGEQWSSRSPLSRALAVGTFALGAISAAKNGLEGNYAEALRGAISSTAAGAELVTGVASSIAAAARAAGQDAALATRVASFASRFAGPLAVASAGLSLAERATRENRAELGNLVGAIGDVVSVVGGGLQTSGIGYPVGALISTVGSVVSAAGDAITAFNNASQNRADDKAALAAAYGTNPQETDRLYDRLNFVKSAQTAGYSPEFIRANALDPSSQRLEVAQALQAQFDALGLTAQQREQVLNAARTKDEQEDLWRVVSMGGWSRRDPTVPVTPAERRADMRQFLADLAQRRRGGLPPSFVALQGQVG